MFVSCPYADTELSAVEDLLADHPPTIDNDFEDMIVGNSRTLSVETFDLDEDEVSVSAISSNSDIVAVRMDGNLLTITPHASEGQSEVTVKASAYDKEAAKSFVVAAAKEDVFFGKAFTIDGRFDGQGDLDKYKVVLEGSCTIQGDNGYSYQRFYTSVSDMDGNYLAGMNNSWIERAFTEDLYMLAASLEQTPGGYYHYSYEPESASYELSVSCPDADTDISVVLDMLDDAPPVINNDFDDLELTHSAVHNILIDATDEVKFLNQPSEKLLASLLKAMILDDQVFDSNRPNEGGNPFFGISWWIPAFRRNDRVFIRNRAEKLDD